MARRLKRATKGGYPGQLARAVIKRLLLLLALAMFNNYNGRRGKVGWSGPDGERNELAEPEKLRKR